MSAPPKYLHREAYAHMWYGCLCGHRERLWNSRDGVTAFAIPCPSCGSLSLTHIAFHLDQCDPNHTPHHGQKVWASVTKEHARRVAEMQAAAHRACGRDLPEDFVTVLADHIYHGGDAPELQITGWRL